MHGFELELETLLDEYQAKQDYGAFMACLLKPALFVLQSLNQKGSQSNNGNGKQHIQNNGSANQEDEANNCSNGKTKSYSLTLKVICLQWNTEHLKLWSQSN